MQARDVTFFPHGDSVVPEQVLRAGMCCSPDKDLASLNLGKLLSFQNLLAPYGKVTKVRLGQIFCFSNPSSCTHGKGKFQMKPSEEGRYLSDV